MFLRRWGGGVIIYKKIDLKEIKFLQENTREKISFTEKSKRYNVAALRYGISLPMLKKRKRVKYCFNSGREISY